MQRIVTHIAPQIRDEELRRALRKRPDSMTAYDRMLQALHLMDYLDKDMFERARDVLEQAMKDDPFYAMPVAWSVWWRIIWIGQGWSSEHAADFAVANNLANRAITLDPNNALALAIVGHLHSFLLHDYDAALTFFCRAVVAGPGNAIVLSVYALTLAYVGRGQDAVGFATQAINLSPLDQKMFWLQNCLALAHFAEGSYAEAARWARASDRGAPRFTANLRTLIAALVAAGAEDEAREVAERLVSLEPGFRCGRYEQTLLPYRPPEIRAKFMAGLRAAGLPE